MKLDPKPFETLFQQVIRLEKNIYDLKESIFQFLKSDKGLKASKRNHKEKKDIPSPTYPKIKIKKIVDGFGAKMAEIDKAIGFEKAIEKRKKRSINENENPDTNKETQNIIKPIKTHLRQRKFYNGQYALLNELPTVWNFFKELWNKPKPANTAEKKPVQEEINFSEIKPTEVKTKDVTDIPLNTQETTPTETQTTKIESGLAARSNKIPQLIKGIENIQISSNSTNGTTKPKYIFKCQYFCRIINVTTEATKINTISRIPHLATETEITTENKLMETSKSTSRKYETTTFWKYNTQNEETTSETEFAPATIETEYTPTIEEEETFPTSNPTTTDPQPIELDTSMSEITTETIPSVLIPNNNDEILITVRQPNRSTTGYGLLR